VFGTLFTQTGSAQLRFHRLLTACLVQNDYSSPGTPQPYDMQSAVCSHQQWGPSPHPPSVLELYHQLIFVRTILLLHAIMASCMSPAAQRYPLCYWPVLLVTTKDIEVLKEVDSTQHNLHSVSSNTTSSQFAVFIFCQLCCLVTDSAVFLSDITALEVYIEMSHSSVIFVSGTF
jgi:hypothetical protein